MDNPPVMDLQWSRFRLTIGKDTLVMGIVNVTPDSFSDGGLFMDKKAAVTQGKRLASEGAHIIDVGGESTRPFSEPVSPDEEMRRVLPVIEELSEILSVPISIDTRKAEVARRALAAGASMVNDIGALRLDPAMAGVAAEAGVPVVLMHMKGAPETMQTDPYYEDVVSEVKTFLDHGIERARHAGIERSKIIIDPGIGFGKTVKHNLLLIEHLSALRPLGVPVLIGPSRKSFITKILGPGHGRREVGTQAAVAAAVLHGAHIVRVHDVARTKATLKVVDAIKDPEAISVSRVPRTNP